MLTACSWSAFAASVETPRTCVSPASIWVGPEVASGVLVAPEAIPSSLVLSAADMNPFTDVVTTLWRDPPALFPWA